MINTVYHPHFRGWKERWSNLAKVIQLESNGVGSAAEKNEFLSEIT